MGSYGLKLAEHLFCNRISEVADVASSVFVGGVGDGIVAEQHYDLDAAANARNTSFPLAPLLVNLKFTTAE